MTTEPIGEPTRIAFYLQRTRYGPSHHMVTEILDNDAAVHARCIELAHHVSGSIVHAHQPLRNVLDARSTEVCAVRWRRRVPHIAKGGARRFAPSQETDESLMVRVLALLADWPFNRHLWFNVGMVASRLTRCPQRARIREQLERLATAGHVERYRVGVTRSGRLWRVPHPRRAMLSEDKESP